MWAEAVHRTTSPIKKPAAVKTRIVFEEQCGSKFVNILN